MSAHALHIYVSIGVKFGVGNLYKTFLSICLVREGRRRLGKADFSYMRQRNLRVYLVTV